jgi:hypothetical protein
MFPSPIGISLDWASFLVTFPARRCAVGFAGRISRLPNVGHSS